MGEGSASCAALGLIRRSLQKFRVRRSVWLRGRWGALQGGIRWGVQQAGQSHGRCKTTRMAITAPFSSPWMLRTKLGRPKWSGGGVAGAGSRGKRHSGAAAMLRLMYRQRAQHAQRNTLQHGNMVVAHMRQVRLCTAEEKALQGRRSWRMPELHIKF